MRIIIDHIRTYFNQTFNAIYLLLILLMIGMLIYWNYWHGLEKHYVGGHANHTLNFIAYYLFYFIPFATAFFLQYLFYSDCNYYSNKWFWVILFLAPAFFAFRTIFDFHHAFILNIFPESSASFYLYCSNWLVRVFTVLIPIALIWFIKDKGTQPFYGFKSISSISPYGIMLAIMIPLVVLASTQKDFLLMYPKAHVINGLSTGLPQARWRYLLFEICYGIDFTGIELFFRGFLILSLMRICGPQCIIPVACFYCTIHFGKPIGEAISSFFGGTILGIVAYYTRSIWGGLIVHLGIAWMMELGGYLGNSFLH